MNKLDKRFWDKVDKSDSNKCWNWNKSLNKCGYGQFRIDNKSVLAHRFSYLLENGEIPNSMIIMHTCDNPKCVNPKHLLLGTQKDNVVDCVNKKRFKSNKGIDNPRAKLTLSKVNKIRKMYGTKKYTQAKLSEIYKVTQVNISEIIRYKIWN